MTSSLPPVAAPVVAIVRALIEERTGLHYGSADQDLLIERVQSRAIDAGFDSLLDYYYFLRYDAGSAAEMDALIDALVVNETYFFREAGPLRVAIDSFLRPAVAAGRRPRVWCAAASTGEEPFTLAMMLAERELLDRVQIIASDLSMRALDRARSGKFSRRSVRGQVPEESAARWLRAEAGGGWSVPASLGDLIEWRRINLCDAEAVASVGQCDVIFCRNVLIYFSDETVTKVAAGLARALRSDGALFVGISESLLRYATALICEERDGAFYYRKAS